MDHLYFLPANRRAEEEAAAAEGRPSPAAMRLAKGDVHFDADVMPDRSVFIRSMMAMQGGKAAEWAARWDAMAAASADAGVPEPSAAEREREAKAAEALRRLNQG